MVDTIDSCPAVDTLTFVQPTNGDEMPKKLDILPPDEIIANLDKQIAFLRARLDRLEHLRFALDDPGTRDCLAVAMTHTWEEVLDSSAAKVEQVQLATGINSTSKAPTHFERVEFFFSKTNNEWATSEQISKGALVKRQVLGDVLYKTHKDRFARKDNPKGRGKLFRLIPAKD